VRPDASGLPLPFRPCATAAARAPAACLYLSALAQPRPPGRQRPASTFPPLRNRGRPYASGLPLHFRPCAPVRQRPAFTFLPLPFTRAFLPVTLKI